MSMTPATFWGMTLAQYAGATRAFLRHDERWHVRLGWLAANIVNCWRTKQPVKDVREWLGLDGEKAAAVAPTVEEATAFRDTVKDWARDFAGVDLSDPATRPGWLKGETP